jgi:hypothetical protein
MPGRNQSILLALAVCLFAVREIQEPERSRKKDPHASPRFLCLCEKLIDHMLEVFLSDLVACGATNLMSSLDDIPEENWPNPQFFAQTDLKIMSFLSACAKVKENPAVEVTEEIDKLTNSLRWNIASIQLEEIDRDWCLNWLHRLK